MKCHEFRAAVAAEPSAATPDVLSHAAQCDVCAAYREQMLEMDRLIHKALAIPLDDRRAASPKTQQRATFARWQIAASLVAATALATSIWVASTRESLAEHVVRHTEREAFALERSDERVTDAKLHDVLEAAGLRLRAEVADVSYVANCRFRGHLAPHLVVQTPQGPVTVLVLIYEQPTRSTRRFAEGSYEGVIVPAPRGVLAVLGQDAPVQAVATTLLGALEYH
jgi:hypothetical protein